MPEPTLPRVPIIRLNPGLVRLVEYLPATLARIHHALNGSQAGLGRDSCMTIRPVDEQFWLKLDWNVRWKAFVLYQLSPVAAGERMDDDWVAATADALDELASSAIKSLLALERTGAPAGGGRMLIALAKGGREQLRQLQEMLTDLVDVAVSPIELGGEGEPDGAWMPNQPLIIFSPSGEVIEPKSLARKQEKPMRIDLDIDLSMPSPRCRGCNTGLDLGDLAIGALLGFWLS